MEYATQYAEVAKLNKQGMRGLARKAALDLLGLKTKVAPSKKLWETPRVQLIYIHHIFEDEREGFRNMLKLFAEHFTFISYSDAVNKILTGQMDKPYMAFSSDDGFKNNLIAAEVLEEFGTTACFFLNPGTIGLTDPDQIQSHCTSRLHFPPVEFLSWAEIYNLQKGGHEIGSHTVWHSKLSEVPIKETQEDLKQSKAMLEKECGPIDHFAYPYGRWFHFSKAALEATWEAGYKSCSSAERGCHLPTQNVNPRQLVLRRDHLLANWPVNHMRYFVENNVKNSVIETQQYPFS